MKSSSSPASSICVLCEQPAILRESHIQSKFFWKNSGVACGPGKTYDLTCINDPHLTNLHKQDGIKERLLCHDCEQRRGKLEKYVQQRFFGTNGVIDFSERRNRIVTGLEYKSVKLFQMFTLFMMGLSRHPFYAHVSLGSHHESKLRRMLMKDDPGEPWEYACACFLLRTGTKEAVGLFSQPERFKMVGLNCYRLAFAGMYWFIWCSSQKPVGIPEPVYLSRSGEWVIFDGQVSDHGALQKQVELKLRTFG